MVKTKRWSLHMTEAVDILESIVVPIEWWLASHKYPPTHSLTKLCMYVYTDINIPNKETENKLQNLTYWGR